MLMSPRVSSAPAPAAKKPKADDASKIKVVVRKRPLSKKERENSAGSIIEVHPRLSGMPAALTVHEPKLKVDLTAYTETHKFLYDEVFDEQIGNAAVYASSARPLINKLFETKQSSTCFAYGATGAGKTHTMMGTDEEPGLYLLAAADLFRLLSLPENKNLQLHAASYEIYGGKVYDLLNGRSSCPVREDGKKKVNIVGLRETHIPSIDAFRATLNAASDARKTAATLANADSSRSHAILQLSIKEAKEGKMEKAVKGRGRQADAAAAAAAAVAAAAGGSLPGSPMVYEEVSRFCFIDLAGTERGADTLNCADKERRQEGAEINKSLLALKECIRSLDSGNKHVPFRGSKLTEVLRDSFVGGCRTVMIGAISPCASSCEQTLNTLRYTALVRELGASSTKVAEGEPVQAAQPEMRQRSATIATTGQGAAAAAAAAKEAAAANAAATEKPTARANSVASMLPAPTPSGLKKPTARNRRRGSLLPLPSTMAAPIVQPPPPPPPPQPKVEEEAPAAQQRTSTSSTTSHSSSLLTSPLLTSPLLTSPIKQKPADPPPPPPPPAQSPAPPPPPEQTMKERGSSLRASLGGLLNNLLGTPNGTSSGINGVGTTPSMGGLSAPPQEEKEEAAPAPPPPPPPAAPREAWSAATEKENTPTGPPEPSPSKQRKSSPKVAKETRRLSERSVTKAGADVFDAHRNYITSCVEQLEVHTFMLGQAEAQPSDAKGLNDYVGSLEALLRERQAALSSLQSQLEIFRHTIGPSQASAHV